MHVWSPSGLPEDALLRAGRRDCPQPQSSCFRRSFFRRGLSREQQLVHPGCEGDVHNMLYNTNQRVIPTTTTGVHAMHGCRRVPWHCRWWRRQPWAGNGMRLLTLASSDLHIICIMDCLSGSPVMLAVSAGSPHCASTARGEGPGCRAASAVVRGLSDSVTSRQPRHSHVR